VECHDSELYVSAYFICLPVCLKCQCPFVFDVDEIYIHIISSWGYDIDAQTNVGEVAGGYVLNATCC